MSSASSSCSSYTPVTKSDIIACAIGNPPNKSRVKLSDHNRVLFGLDAVDLFSRRHHKELQRCSQFYSLASLFDETPTKDK